MSKIYKHVKYNHKLEGIAWALDQVDEGYKLLNVVPYTMYEGVAVFEKEATEFDKQTKRRANHKPKSKLAQENHNG
jgi:hypothetical protein